MKTFIQQNLSYLKSKERDTGEPYTTREAYKYLLYVMCFSEEKEYIKPKKATITIKRGECFVSINSLVSLFHWTPTCHNKNAKTNGRKKVLDCFESWKQDGLIEYSLIKDRGYLLHFYDYDDAVSTKNLEFKTENIMSKVISTVRIEKIKKQKDERKIEIEKAISAKTIKVKEERKNEKTTEIIENKELSLIQKKSKQLGFDISITDINGGDFVGSFGEYKQDKNWYSKFDYRTEYKKIYSHLFDFDEKKYENLKLDDLTDFDNKYEIKKYYSVGWIKRFIAENIKKSENFASPLKEILSKLSMEIELKDLVNSENLKEEWNKTKLRESREAKMSSCISYMMKKGHTEKEALEYYYESEKEERYNEETKLKKESMFSFK
jgi:hypothetical protein